jgi:hypothetical protein
MLVAESELVVEAEPENDPMSRLREYNLHGTRDRQRDSLGSVAPSRRRIRLLYFCLASFCGFLVGLGGLAATLAMLGRPVGLENPAILLGLLAALAMALLVGAVVSAAYREARRRAG